MQITFQAHKKREKTLPSLIFRENTQVLQESLRGCREEERAERGWEREVQRGTGRC